MRVRTFLRPRRLALGLSLADVSARTGIAKGDLSMLERGRLLPRDEQLAPLASVYGDPAAWYPVAVAANVRADMAACPGCGEELPPDARASRRYHDDACRRLARRRPP